LVRIFAENLGEEWRFAVADNGMGIDPKYHQQVFGVFKRLHREAIAGTGIGLAICQRVVERYGGRIWVESQIDEGSTFYFTLPI
jgi:light-regulated signal transduction histidine kinase (bacteriophytochrome)